MVHRLVRSKTSGNHLLPTYEANCDCSSGRFLAAGEVDRVKLEQLLMDAVWRLRGGSSICEGGFA